MKKWFTIGMKSTVLSHIRSLFFLGDAQGSSTLENYLNACSTETRYLLVFKLSLTRSCELG